MNLKIFGAVLALAGATSSMQTPFGYHYTYDVLSHTIASSGWERASPIVTGPTYVECDDIYRNSTWSIELLPDLMDLVRKSAPFEWVEAGSTDSVKYGFHIPEGVTGYVAQTTIWHILTGYIRTKKDGVIVHEQLITTISPKVLFNGGLDGVVRFISIH